MALQLDLADTNVGVPAPTAYARIVGVSFNTTNGLVEIRVDIFASAAARQEGKNPVGGGVYIGTVGLNMPNLDDALPNGIRAVLYAWLKTLPDFQGALDV
jgi:hypothetical protein